MSISEAARTLCHIINKMFDVKSIFCFSSTFRLFFRHSVANRVKPSFMPPLRELLNTENEKRVLFCLKSDFFANAEKILPCILFPAIREEDILDCIYRKLPLISHPDYKPLRLQAHLSANNKIIPIISSPLILELGFPYRLTNILTRHCNSNKSTQ